MARWIASRRSATSMAPSAAARVAVRIAARIAAGFSLRGLSSVTITRSAFSAAMAPISGRFGLVRVIDKDRRAAIGADPFEAAFGAGEMFERGEGRSRVAAGCDRKTRGDQRILDLEFADQRQTELKGFLAVLDPHRLRKAVDLGF